jgi:hypothetical protein
MKRFYFFFLILIPFVTLSQDLATYNNISNDTLSDRLVFEVPYLREHIYNGIPSYSKNGKYERLSFEFADYQALNITDLMTNGDVYSDWNELEDYVNEILQKVLPSELKNDSIIHAYIYKDGGINAFMTASGQFFVNIGMISSCNDEATLASVFAHELAHYYLKHSLDGYFQYKLGNFGNGLSNNDKKYNRFSLKGEIEADSLAMIWLTNSKYNTIGLLKSFSNIERTEQRILSRSEDKWELEEQTHPLSEDRLENFKRFYKKNKDNSGELYLVDEAKFLKFKELAKAESLKYLLQDIEYYECMELAFKYHLMDPDNKTYVYYLMESIRRICYINDEVWNHNFITNRYFDTVRVDGIRRKRPVNRGLFDKLDFNLLPITQEDARYIKAQFYWQGPAKFKTYNEAFEFYNKVGAALNCDECILTNALSLNDTKNKDARNKLLQQYISIPDVKYREYAKDLLNNSLRKKLGTKKLTVFSEFTAYIKQGKERVQIRSLETDSIPIFSNLFDSLMINQPNRIPLFLPDLKKYNISEYNLLKTLEYFTFIRILYMGVNGNKSLKKDTPPVKLHILDPNYISLFQKYNVNEIEFINCDYHESVAVDNSVEGYKKMINTSHEELFNRTKTTKSVDIIVTSLREIDGKRMQVRAFGDEATLKFKEPAYDQIVSEFRHKLKYKEKVAYDNDVIDQKYYGGK